MPLSLLIIIFSFSSFVQGQVGAKINPVLLNRKWKAQWITCPGISLTDFGVFHFRKTFLLQDRPHEFIIHVSGDNRYRLFVNGEEVCKGPARGDLAHWRFETLDIARYLRPGNNVLAAVVWNFGVYKPLAQISFRTAFIVQGDGQEEEIVNTGKGWKVCQDKAYTPPLRTPPHTTVGPEENVIGSLYPWGWEQIGYDDHAWLRPELLGNGIPRGSFTFWDWGLIPRKIPFVEYRQQRLGRVRRSENIRVDDRFLSGNAPLQIPPHRKVKILLDQTFLTTAYPEILVSGGKGSTIVMDYAEALVDKQGVKGNRVRIGGKTMPGYFSDRFRPDGGEDRHYQPLWFRTYRYLELTVETGNDPLIIKDLYGWFTAYPFEERASFRSNDTTLLSLWKVGWRTARLCAGETYYDCPYYEQLQYVGDTRIQALISLYVAGDDRLMRKAIEQFHDSQLSSGLTQSRYPCWQPQVIPPFSLLWIEMLHDYWMHRDDTLFVKKYLNGIQNVLSWYQQHIDEKGMLGPMEWWNFVDWSFGPWNSEKPIGGTPQGAIDGNSSILTLQYVHALQMAAEMFRAFGDDCQADRYRELSRTLINKTYKLCWDQERGLLSDTPEGSSFSQHANILAILTGMFSPSQSTSLFDRIVEDKKITQATFYFKFYLVEAMVKAGRADDYLDLLDPWKKMLETGLTTFAETPEPTRSDCHAWSASPNYHLLSVVAGIRPASPGFRTVMIEPHPGKLEFIDARMHHDAGDIIVKVSRRKNNGLTGEVVLPEGLSGHFVWKGRSRDLKSVLNKIDL